VQAAFGMLATGWVFDTRFPRLCIRKQPTAFGMVKISSHTIYPVPQFRSPFCVVVSAPQYQMLITSVYFSHDRKSRPNTCARTTNEALPSSYITHNPCHRIPNSAKSLLTQISPIIQNLVTFSPIFSALLPSFFFPT
jgi:hypothetical protein